MKVKDYDIFEFRSLRQMCGNVQHEYKADNYDKVKVLDIDIKARRQIAIYIPAYWWYTITFDVTI